MRARGSGACSRLKVAWQSGQALANTVAHMLPPMSSPHPHPQADEWQGGGGGGPLPLRRVDHGLHLALQKFCKHRKSRKRGREQCA